MSEKVILFGEDNHIEARVFKSLVENCEDIKLIHFDNGKDIYDYVKENLHDLPDLIILDINMPQINGIDLIDLIRSENVLVPILIFSTSNNMKDISCSYVNGANGYIVKPIDYDEFEKTFNIIKDYWLKVNTICYYNNEDCKYAKDTIY